MNEADRNIQGFSLMEIVVTVGIMAVLGTLALVSFNASRNARELTTSVQDTISVLRLAQSKTIAGENNQSWGVRLEANHITLFRGLTFASATFTEVYLLPSSIEMNSIALLGGGIDVIFNRVSGTTDQSGTFIMRPINNPSTFISVTVHASGKIYLTNTFQTLTNTRLIDTRHRSFNLGWSIQSSTILTLTFYDPPNPNIINTITMASYFDAPKSKFDWSGITSVGGQDQDLRIHTTFLDNSNTILSVDRDCRKNSKKVNIAINSSNIATFETDCVTATAESSGGVMSEP